MRFWRISNNKIVDSKEVSMVGYDINAKYYTAPQEYLDKQEFIIFRTALGIGDWVMMERIAYNLKLHYSNCKVYLPSPKMLKQIFGNYINQWSSWGDASTTVELMFKNNPYIDGYVDNWYTEVYHDHFRIYDSNNPKITLCQQMCKFHRIDYNKITDNVPQIYFTSEEIKKGNIELRSLPSTFEFLHLSDRYTEEDSDILLNYIEQLGLINKDFVTYYKGDINNSKFKNLNIKNNIINITDPRIQFYIKSKANNVIGVQTGATDVISGLTQVHSLHHSKELEDTWKVGNYIPTINYINRKNYI